MPDVKVVDNVFKNISHVASYGDVSVRDEGCDQEAITNQIVHALFECHKLHCRTAPCLVPLQ